MICKRTCNECDFFWNISVSYSYSYNRLVETLGLLCGSSDNLVIVFQHSNVHQPSGNNVLQNVYNSAYCRHCIPNTATQIGVVHKVCRLKTTIFDPHPPLSSNLLTGIYLLNCLRRYPIPSPTKMT